MRINHFLPIYKGWRSGPRNRESSNPDTAFLDGREGWLRNLEVCKLYNRGLNLTHTLKRISFFLLMLTNTDASLINYHLFLNVLINLTLFIRIVRFYCLYFPFPYRVNSSDIGEYVANSTCSHIQYTYSSFIVYHFSEQNLLNISCTYFGDFWSVLTMVLMVARIRIWRLFRCNKMPSTNRNTCFTLYVRTAFWTSISYRYHGRYTHWHYLLMTIWKSTMLCRFSLGTKARDFSLWPMAFSIELTRIWSNVA